MILVDTSVWIEHFRHGNRRLASILHDAQVVQHSFVIGELACGALPGRRREVLAALHRLPRAPMAGQEEVLALVERRRLMGTGIGWIDAHLLASCLLAHIALWTLDRPLIEQARRLGVDLGP